MDLTEYVKDRVTLGRFAHSQRVAKQAMLLAKKHNIDIDIAYKAGIAHDCCRELTGKELLSLAEHYGIVADEYEQDWPLGLHGKVAAKFLEEEFLLSEEIKEAIAYHVTGHPNMGKLARIIYLADKIEEGRSYPGVEKIREIAETDLNGALLIAIDSAFNYLINKRLPIHPDSLALRNSLLLKHKSGNKL